MARGLIKQSKWTSNCGARRQEGREGWCLVLSEWTNWSRTGGGRENMPPGEPQDPPLSPRLSPLTITSTTTTSSMGSFSLLAGVPSAFMWLLVLHRATLKPCQWELLWLFEPCIRLICCPSQPHSSLSLSYCSGRLSLDVELSAENTNVLKLPLQALKYQTKQKRGRAVLMKI